MLRALKLAWSKWIDLGKFMGGKFMSVFLFVFYYSAFAIFALPFKFSKNPLAPQSANSNWIPKKRNAQTLEDFQHEY